MYCKISVIGIKYPQNHYIFRTYNLKVGHWQNQGNSEDLLLSPDYKVQVVY